MNYYDRVKRQHGIYFNLLSKYNLHPLKKDHWIYAYKQMLVLVSNLRQLFVETRIN